MKRIPPALYNQILRTMPIPCVDIALVHKGAVLLVRRNAKPAKGEWWVPGGRVLKGEMMADTAKRKALEEVGIEVQVGPIVHTAETIFPDGPENIPIHSINSCFFVYPLKKNCKPVLDTLHKEYKWVSSFPASLHPYVERCLLGAGLFPAKAGPT